MNKKRGGSTFSPSSECSQGFRVPLQQQQTRERLVPRNLLN